LLPRSSPTVRRATPVINSLLGNPCRLQCHGYLAARSNCVPR